MSYGTLLMSCADGVARIVLNYLRELLVLVGLSDDAEEGLAAFFEKRAPQWKGR